MASSGSYTTNAVASSRSLTFSWWINWQDIPSNTTQIGWQLVGSGGTSGSWVKGQNFRQWVNGNYYESTPNRNVYNGTVIIGGTTNILHKSNGYKSFSANTIGQMYNYTDNTTGSGSWDLPNIPRQANLTGANDFNDEQNPYLTFNNAGGFPLNVRLEFAGLVIQRNDIPNTGNYTFVLSQAERDLLLSKCSGSNSMTVRYVVATKLNGNETWWSMADRTMTVVNATPAFSNFTYADTNATTKGLTGNDQVLIKGYSTLRATISSANKMVAKKQSIAKNYGATCDSRTSSINYATTDVSIDLGTIVSAGTKRLSVRAYDSRNNSSEVYKDILVYDYNAPVINASIMRLNNFEAQTTLKVNGTYSPLNIGSSDKNIITTTGVQYRYRESGGTWGNWTNLTRTLNASAGTFNCTDVSLTLDNTKSYEFEIRAVDKITTSTLSTSIDIGIPPFFISSNLKAVGVNCIPPNNAPAGSIWYNNKQVLDYDVVDSW